MTSRGNRQEAVYETGIDKESFLSVVFTYVTRKADEFYALARL